jgi:8-oxo-dGTP pyrophosphatase MutT (NUDIX family)
MTDAPPDGEMLSRVAARVLLIDAADRLLLMRGLDPGRPLLRYWFTVGGGLDDGESTLDAAVRELFEETGLRLPASALAGPVFHETTYFPFDGHWYSQEQDFFVARVDTWDADLSGFSDIERATVEEVRWWSLDELIAATDTIYPANLVPLLRSVLAPGTSVAGSEPGTAAALSGSADSLSGPADSLLGPADSVPGLAEGDG